MPSQHWWVGGYGPEMDGSARGIGLMSARADGSLEHIRTVAEIDSPAYLASGDGLVFAATEATGRVEVFAITEGNGLRYLGGASSGGGLPCHLTVHEGAVIATNYHDGSVGIIDSRRRLVQVMSATGSEPHAHSTMFLDATTLASLDLGTDSVHLYSVTGTHLERIGTVSLPAGTGPRDIARHDSGLLHILGELGGVVLVARWADARLEIVASTPLPGFIVGDHAAALAFHGNFTYAGVRGSNRISVLRSSADGLEVEPVGSVSCEGQWPRHLVVDDGVLHVANQISGDIASFRLGDDGMPSMIGTPVPVPSPTFLLRAP